MTSEPSTGSGRSSGQTRSVADDRIYVPVDAVSDRARHRYRLHALEAGPGEERWTFNVPGDRFESPIALDDQYVYVPTRDTLYAITRDGEKAWSAELADDGAGPPTISGEVITLPETIVMSGSGGRVTALGAE